MPYCPICGYKIQSGDNYCFECGNSLSTYQKNLPKNHLTTFPTQTTTCKDAVINAITEIGRAASAREISEAIYKKYSDKPWKENSIRCHLIGLSVNHPSSKHYPHLHKQACLYTPSRGMFRLYNPEKDDIKEIPSGGLDNPSPTKLTVEEFEKLPTKRISSRERIEERISEITSSKDFFNACIKSFYKRTPFESKFRQGIKNHQEVIRVYRINKEDYSSLFDKEFFLELVYNTVKSWGMSSRAARMVELNNFIENIQANKDEIIRLNEYKLHALNDNEVEGVKTLLVRVFSGLRTMQGSSQLVGNSKTLHHLLPDLVPPMDRTYTLNFFYGNTNLWRDQEKDRFLEIFENFYKICNKLGLSEDDLGDDYFDKSIPKVIDNAIIGYLLMRSK